MIDFGKLDQIRQRRVQQSALKPYTVGSYDYDLVPQPIIQYTPEQLRSQQIRTERESGQEQVAQELERQQSLESGGFFSDIYQSARGSVSSIDLEQDIQKAAVYENNQEKADQLRSIQKRVNEIRAESEKANTSGIFGQAAGLIGGIVDAARESLGYAGAGAASGAALGAVGGPLAGITALGGAKVGFAGGQFKYWMDQGGGSVYSRLRDEGIDHDTARKVAMGAGPVYAAVEQATRFLPKPLQSALIRPFRETMDRSLTRAALKVAAKRVSDATLESAEEGVQQGIQDGAYLVASELTNGLNEEGNPLAQLTGNEVFKNMIDSGVEAFGPTMLITGTLGGAEFRKTRNQNAQVKAMERRLGVDDAQANQLLEQATQEAGVDPQVNPITGEPRPLFDRYVEKLNQYGQAQEAQARAERQAQADAEAQRISAANAAFETESRAIFDVPNLTSDQIISSLNEIASRSGYNPELNEDGSVKTPAWKVAALRIYGDDSLLAEQIKTRNLAEAKEAFNQQMAQYEQTNPARSEEIRRDKTLRGLAVQRVYATYKAKLGDDVFSIDDLKGAIRENKTVEQLESERLARFAPEESGAAESVQVAQTPAQQPQATPQSTTKQIEDLPASQRVEKARLAWQKASKLNDGGLTLEEEIANAPELARLKRELDDAQAALMADPEYIKLNQSYYDAANLRQEATKNADKKIVDAAARDALKIGKQDISGLEAGERPDGSKFDLVSESVGAEYDAHGSSKGSFEQQARVLDVLLGGLANLKSLFTAPFSAGIDQNTGGVLGAGSAYKDGVFVVTSNRGTTIADSGIKHVFVNDAFPQLKDAIQQKYGDKYGVHFMSEQKAVLEKRQSTQFDRRIREQELPKPPEVGGNTAPVTLPVTPTEPTRVTRMEQQPDGTETEVVYERVTAKSGREGWRKIDPQTGARVGPFLTSGKKVDELQKLARGQELPKPPAPPLPAPPMTKEQAGVITEDLAQRQATEQAPTGITPAVGAQKELSELNRRERELRKVNLDDMTDAQMQELEAIAARKEEILAPATATAEERAGLEQAIQPPQATEPEALPTEAAVATRQPSEFDRLAQQQRERAIAVRGQRTAQVAGQLRDEDIVQRLQNPDADIQDLLPSQERPEVREIAPLVQALGISQNKLEPLLRRAGYTLERGTRRITGRPTLSAERAAQEGRAVTEAGAEQAVEGVVEETPESLAEKFDAVKAAMFLMMNRRAGNVNKAQIAKLENEIKGVTLNGKPITRATAEELATAALESQAALGQEITPDVIQAINNIGAQAALPQAQRQLQEGEQRFQTASVFRGSVQEAGGANVGATLGSGVYVTSNMAEEGRLAAIDYAGGKFTQGKSGYITESELNLDDANVLYTGQRYNLDDLIQDTRLASWFRERLQSWKDKGWYKNGLRGSDLVQFIQSPPPNHGNKMDFGKAGFDGVATLNEDGTIYEASITNPNILKEIRKIRTEGGRVVEDGRFQTSVTNNQPATKDNSAEYFDNVARGIQGAKFTKDTVNPDSVGLLQVGNKLIRIVIEDLGFTPSGQKKLGAVRRMSDGTYTIVIDRKNGNITTPRHELGHIIFDSLTDGEKKAMRDVLGYDISSLGGQERFVIENLESDESRIALAEKIGAAGADQRGVIVRALNKVIRGLNSILGFNIQEIGRGAKIDKITSAQLAQGLRDLSILLRNPDTQFMTTDNDLAASMASRDDSSVKENEAEWVAGVRGVPKVDVIEERAQADTAQESIMAYQEFERNFREGQDWKGAEGKAFIAYHRSRENKSQTLMQSYNKWVQSGGLNSIIEGNKLSDSVRKNWAGKVNTDAASRLNPLGIMSKAKGVLRRYHQQFGMSIRTLARDVSPEFGDFVEQNLRPEVAQTFKMRAQELLDLEVSKKTRFNTEAERKAASQETEKLIERISTAEDVRTDLNGLLSAPQSFTAQEYYQILRYLQNEDSARAIMGNGLVVYAEDRPFTLRVKPVSGDKAAKRAALKSWAESEMSARPDFAVFSRAQNKISDMMFPEINEVYKRLVPKSEWPTETGLKKEEFYTAMHRDVEPNASARNRNRLVMLLKSLGSIKEREKIASQPLRITNGLEDFYDTINRGAGFIANAEFATRARSLLAQSATEQVAGVDGVKINPTSLGREIIKYRGQEFFENLLESIDQVEGTAYNLNAIEDGTINRMMKYIARGALTGPTTMAMQGMSFFIPLVKYSPDIVTEGYTSASRGVTRDFLLNMARQSRYGGAILHRVANSLPIEEAQRINYKSKITRFNSAIDRLDRIGFAGMRYVDSASVFAHGRVAWAAVQRKMPTASDQEKADAFVKEWNDLLQYQMTGDPSMKVLSHNRGGFGAVLNMFRSTINSQYLKIYEQYQKAKQTGNKQDVNDLVQRVGMTAISMTLYATAIRMSAEAAREFFTDIFGDDEDKKRIAEQREYRETNKMRFAIKEMISGIAQQLPITTVGGSLVDGLTEYAILDRRSREKFMSANAAARVHPASSAVASIFNVTEALQRVQDALEVNEENPSVKTRKQLNSALRALYKSSLEFSRYTPASTPIPIWSNFLSLDKALFNVEE